MDVDIEGAVVCGACAWFGVYRSDVVAQLHGCPNCGADALIQRDLRDVNWRELGAELERGASPGLGPL